jgi:hypothetical protein
MRKYVYEGDVDLGEGDQTKDLRLEQTSEQEKDRKRNRSAAPTLQRRPHYTSHRLLF